jgi:hypothetical protein
MADSVAWENLALACTRGPNYWRLINAGERGFDGNLKNGVGGFPEGRSAGTKASARETGKAGKNGTKKTTDAAASETEKGLIR